MNPLAKWLHTTLKNNEQQICIRSSEYEFVWIEDTPKKNNGLSAFVFTFKLTVW